jgi:hypothetical protein
MLRGVMPDRSEPDPDNAGGGNEFKLNHSLIIRCSVMKRVVFYFLGVRMMRFKVVSIVFCMVVITLFACSSSEQQKDEKQNHYEGL